MHTKATSIVIAAIIAIVSLMNPVLVQAALPGAHSNTVSGDVFLGGDYVELGISKYGSFGTDQNKPSGFYGTAARNQIGMSSDLDGFNTGTDWRMDFFMPGTQEERWSVGYKIGASTYTASNAQRSGGAGITDNSVTNQSADDVLKATSVGNWNSTLRTTQVIQFNKGDKFFKNTVTLENIHGSNTVTSVRYMRSFDPDNTVDKGGSYTTHNRILYTHAAGDGKAVVRADTSNNASDPVYTGTGGASGGTRSPVLFYSSDSRARVGYHTGLNPGTVYQSAVYDSTPAKGSNENRDGAISIAFDVGTLAPGENASFVYYTSLDERDFGEVEEEIAQDEAESAPAASAITATPGPTSATVTWTTDVAASSIVEYGLVPAYGFSTNEINTSPRVTAHSVNVTGLKSCARYFYRVKSTNSSSGVGTSSASTFTTTGCPTSSITEGSEQSITTAGGTLTYTSGSKTARITVPSGFHNATASFQVNRLSTSGITAPTGKSLSGTNIYDLIAVDGSDTRLESFSSPVTFVVTYTDDEVSDFDESTLDVYRYTDGAWVAKNCTLDTAANTLTCSLTGFSVYAVFGVGGGGSSASSSSSSPTSSTGPTVCSDMKPEYAPDLFQISASGTTATVYFAPILGIDDYYISYSTDPSAQEHGASVRLGHEGVQSYTITDLSPHTAYYYKVRGQRGCMPGDWSTIRSAGAPAASQPLIQSTNINPTPTLKLQAKRKPTPTKEPVIAKKQPTPTPTAVAANACTYRVKSGDSLWAISQELLGSGARYTDLIEANKDRLSSITEGLSPDMKLVYPCESIPKDVAKTPKKDGYLLALRLESDGKPLANVDVELHSKPRYGKTDSEGRVTFDNVEGGNHTLYLAYANAQATQKITVDGDEREKHIVIQVEMKHTGTPTWVWILIFLVLLLCNVCFWLWFSKRKHKKSDVE